MKSQITVTVYMLAVFGVLAVVPTSGQSAKPPISKERMDRLGDHAWILLPSNEQHPEFFEGYLKQHPEDQAHRDAALWWYGLQHPNQDRLRFHTLLMVQYHPDSKNISFDNTTAFYAEPSYLEEVIERLEGQTKRANSKPNVYWNLAQACEQAAIPPTTEQHKTRFLRYYGLPAGTKLRTTIDEPMAAKAISYYEKAIAVSGHNWFNRAFFGEQLARLFIDLDKEPEAIAVCQSILNDVDEVSKPDFLVTYGSCLYTAGRGHEAEKILDQVRDSDHEGSQHGPGHATMEAENKMGQIALKEGRVADAVKHLLASCAVQGCCHNNTKGFPLGLAGKLLEAGQAAPVAKYCQTILTKFTPNLPEAKALLARAQHAAAGH